MTHLLPGTRTWGPRLVFYNRARRRTQRPQVRGPKSGASPPAGRHPPASPPPAAARRWPSRPRQRIGPGSAARFAPDLIDWPGGTAVFETPPAPGVPEPSTAMLLVGALGTAAAIGLRRRLGRTTVVDPRRAVPRMPGLRPWAHQAAVAELPPPSSSPRVGKGLLDSVTTVAFLCCWAGRERPIAELPPVRAGPAAFTLNEQHPCHRPLARPGNTQTPDHAGTRTDWGIRWLRPLPPD